MPKFDANNSTTAHCGELHLTQLNIEFTIKDNSIKYRVQEENGQDKHVSAAGQPAKFVI